MSLVGTRPPTVDEWDKYELHHRARLATKPGLTGMWQVSGRSNITDFGTGIKQLEPVDASNHIIMDYSIHDAIEAGFNHVVFIIRKDIEKEFKEVIGDRITSICSAHNVTVDYICSRRTQMKTMPEDPVTVKTIVTIDMAERIAAKYGVKTINVLTGFKFIGEQIGFLEKQGKEDSYIFGMEESYGYLSGSYVQDKDGVNAAFLICEMFTYYASQGIGLFEKLNELYAEYGYCLNTLHSYTFEGSAGFEKMQNIMVSFRKSITEFAGKKVLKCLDYSEGIDGLPNGL